VNSSNKVGVSNNLTIASAEKQATANEISQNIDPQFRKIFVGGLPHNL
jgi:hypothetical protein